MNSDIEISSDEEYQLPCAEALLAGTLALMTGHVQTHCDGHRELMNAKIVTNLARLVEHPVLSPQFRAALGNLRTHWQVMARKHAPVPAAGDPRLWLASPSAIQ